MSTDDAGEKSEQPTERRRTEARERGNIARSTDLTAAGVLMASSLALYLLGGSCGETLIQFLRGSLSADPWMTLDRADVNRVAWAIGGTIGMAFLPLLVAIALGSLATNLAQVGFLWSTESLAPNFERINPLKGVQRLFSMSSLVRLGGSLAKISLVCGVAYLYLSSHQAKFLALSQQDAGSILAIAGQSVLELGFYVALTLISLAVTDYGYQYWQHEQDLRMTKQELREELKEMDGNPQVRARRREAHRKLTSAKEMNAVKTADVVVTNPTEIAVAIKYDPKTMPAPIVVAKGMGEIAANIRRTAAEHGVPILERKPLARALYKDVKVGQPIPVEMYEVFIEILAYVYRITGKKPPVTA